MIRITVVSRQGLPEAGSASADFGPEGGTIGRADTNTLVLSDPDRTVSRVHAQVLAREGAYVIVDRGSNPLQCNGQPLGSGREVSLREGDHLVIGSFELRVEVVAAPGASAAGMAGAALGAPLASSPVAAAAGDDPFADLLAGLGAPVPASAAPSANRAVAAVAPDAPFADPLGAAASAPPAGLAGDPFADLLGPAPAAAGTPASSSLPADDFLSLGLPTAANATASAQRIDELFGGTGGGLGGDPLALSPLADPLLQPNTASSFDPLAAFGQAPAAPQAARSDHLPIGQFGFVPPKSAAGAPVAAPMPVAPPVRAQADDDPVVRFDDQTGQPIRISHSPAAPESPVAAGLAAPPAPSAPAPAATGGGSPAMPLPGAPDDPFANFPGGDASPTADAFDDLLSGLVDGAPTPAAPALQTAPLSPHQLAPLPPPPPAPVAAAIEAVPTLPPAPVPAPPAVPAPAAVPGGASAATEGAELLAAFLRGLGPTHQAPSMLTPALMERIGSLLRSSTEGTLQLLLTRQEFKREVRAEVTMIAAQANNPLKFSPTADVALTHLLGPGVRGFMPAEAAMRDAYDDLRAHQFGVMVGMRAALARLIERFGPDELEKKIAARSALDSLFAANRKAKLWDQFTALYGAIASEAEDDFHALFGKAFLEAYEEQMARLKGEGRPES